MTERDRPDIEGGPGGRPAPPEREPGAAQRRALDARIRALRRRIVATSLVGTAAFSS